MCAVLIQLVICYRENFNPDFMMDRSESEQPLTTGPMMSEARDLEIAGPAGQQTPLGLVMDGKDSEPELDIVEGIRIEESI